MRCSAESLSFSKGFEDAASDDAPLKVLFAAGGTGGHVYPAIAIADEIQRATPSAQILFVGSKDRMESTVVPSAGFRFVSIPTVRIQRPIWSPANLLLPLLLARSLLECCKIIWKERPDVVVGTGGYVSAPTCLAAAFLGCRVAIQEQNAFPGIANRIISWFARIVFVAFSAAIQFFPEKKCVLVGNPTRFELNHPLPKPKAISFFFEAFEEDSPKPLEAVETLVVLGGSLGAKPINDAVLGGVLQWLDAKSTRLAVWQTGSRYMDSIASSLPSHPRLAILPFIQNMNAAYSFADLVIARAGAITCSELLSTGKPSILIPSPNVAENHQTMNAMALINIGAAVLLHENNLSSSSLFDLVNSVMDDKEKLGFMSKKALQFSSPDASSRIAMSLIQLARKDRKKATSTR